MTLPIVRWIAAPTLVYAASLLSMGCAATPCVRQGSAQQVVVSRSWNVPVETIRAGVIEAFTARDRQLGYPFEYMSVRELKPPGVDPDWLATFVDPGDFLKRYKAMAPERRADDVLIEEPTGDRYWASEYTTPAGPAQFRCGFVLHFEKAAGTTLEVYETVPMAWVGEHWAWSMHGIGFGRYHDIRFVEPTVQDREHVLDLVESIVERHQ